MTTPTLSVIAPIYNELDNLRPLMTAIREVLDRERWSYEVVLVDDGSTDGSRDLLRALVEEHPMLRVVFFRRNYGQTAAIGAGFEAARGDIIVPIDADLQNDPKDIPRLIGKLEEGYEVVSGWRRDRQDASARVLPSRIANWMISHYGRVPLHDTGCTLKAYRRTVADELRLYGEMHRFLPIYASLVGARVTELPVQHHPRRAGKSKYGFSRVVKIIPDLLLVMFLRTFAQKPIQLFGGVGIGAIGLGVLSALGAVLALIFGQSGGIVAQRSFVVPGLFLAALTLALAGMICIFLGLQAEVLLRTYYESRGRRPYLVAEEFGNSPLAEPRR